MTEVFFHKRRSDYFNNRRFVDVRLHKLFQVDFSVVEETHLQMTIRSYPDSIAASAKVLAHAAYEAKLALVPRDLKTFRR